MKAKSKILLLLLISLYACRENKIVSVVELFDGESISLSHKKLSLKDDSAMLLSPGRIEIENEFMIVRARKTSKLLSLVDLNSNAVVKSWCNKGNGPGEYIGILNYYKNYNNTGINAWDGALQRMNFFSYESIFNDPDPFSIDLFADNKSMLKADNSIDGFYANMLQLSKTLFLGFGNNKGKRFTLFDLEKQTKMNVGDFPDSDIHKDAEPFFRNQAYSGYFNYNSELDKVIYMSMESEMFEIFNIVEDSMTLAYGNYTTIPQYIPGSVKLKQNTKEEKFTNGKGRLVYLVTSVDKIFLLYECYPKGASDSDISAYLSSKADLLLVFDWNGKPIQKYKLDCMVTELGYDSKRNRLYAIKPKPDPEIVYFDLP